MTQLEYRNTYKVTATFYDENDTIVVATSPTLTVTKKNGTSLHTDTMSPSGDDYIAYVDTLVDLALTGTFILRVQGLVSSKTVSNTMYIDVVEVIS
jgi:hypothetical protein